MLAEEISCYTSIRQHEHKQDHISELFSLSLAGVVFAQTHLLALVGRCKVTLGSVCHLRTNRASDSLITLLPPPA